MTESDQELLGRFVLSQEESAFEQLVQRHAPMVMGVCRRILGNSPEAEDSFQAVFLILARKSPSLRKDQSLGGWLYRVAVNAALESRNRAVTRQKYYDNLQMEQEIRQDEESHSEDSREVHSIIDAELNRLPEKYRSSLVLCYLEGLTYEQAASKLGLSYGGIKRRLDRARDLLRIRLERKGVAFTSIALSAWLSENALAEVTSESMAAAVKVATQHGSTAMAAGSSTQVMGLSQVVMKSMLLKKLGFAVATSCACLSITATGVVWLCTM
jgi:RNA polymerase sigma factor (sigma-70 family)